MQKSTIPTIFVPLFLFTLAVYPDDAVAQQAKNRDRLQAPRVTAHEWGVWKVRAGVVTHLEELAAETPGFVIRSPSVTVPSPIPRPIVQPGQPQLPQPVLPLPPINHPIAPPPQVARKPVMFFTTDRATSMTVEVGFRGGEPWLYYPSASIAGSPGGSRTLTFRGRLVPSARAQLPWVDSSHWWQELRNVGADLFLGSEGRAEGFLFYDGPVQFERPFVISRRPGGAAVSPMSTESTLWLVGSGSFTESQVQRGPQRTTPVGQGDMNALRTRLDEELQARGLSQAEARSLLETWRDELFASAAPRAIYFVPRNLYDHMLPLRIDPQPAELVRVGLVIEEL